MDEEGWRERVCPCGDTFRPKTKTVAAARRGIYCSRKCAANYRVQGKVPGSRDIRARDRKNHTCPCSRCNCIRASDRTELIARVAQQMGVPVATGPVKKFRVTVKSLERRAAQRRAFAKAQRAARGLSF